MPKKSKEGMVEGPDGKMIPWFDDPRITQAFSHLGAARGEPEAMLHLYWSGKNDPKDDGRGHHLQRAKVIADLGFFPDPEFNNADMQRIMFAAKMEAFKIWREKRRDAKRAEKLNKKKRPKVTILVDELVGVPDEILSPIRASNERK